MINAVYRSHPDDVYVLISFSGINNSPQVTVTKLLTNLDRPNVRVQPKPSNHKNLNAKNHTGKHVSHSDFFRLPLDFLILPLYPLLIAKTWWPHFCRHVWAVSYIIKIFCFDIFFLLGWRNSTDRDKFVQNVNNDPSTSSALPKSTAENVSKPERPTGTSNLGRVFGNNSHISSSWIPSLRRISSAK